MLFIAGIYLQIEKKMLVKICKYQYKINVN